VEHCVAIFNNRNRDGIKLHDQVNLSVKWAGKGRIYNRKFWLLSVLGIVRFSTNFWFLNYELVSCVFGHFIA
jgi:hypothetical protein